MKTQSKLSKGKGEIYLPTAALPTLTAFGEALASHHEVDAVSFEKGPKDVEPCRIAVGPMRRLGKAVKRRFQGIFNDFHEVSN